MNHVITIECDSTTDEICDTRPILTGQTRQSSLSSSFFEFFFLSFQSPRVESVVLKTFLLLFIWWISGLYIEFFSTSDRNNKIWQLKRPRQRWFPSKWYVVKKLFFALNYCFMIKLNRKLPSFILWISYIVVWNLFFPWSGLAETCVRRFLWVLQQILGNLWSQQTVVLKFYRAIFVKSEKHESEYLCGARLSSSLHTPSPIKKIHFSIFSTHNKHSPRMHTHAYRRQSNNNHNFIHFLQKNKILQPKKHKLESNACGKNAKQIKPVNVANDMYTVRP